MRTKESWVLKENGLENHGNGNLMNRETVDKTRNNAECIEIADVNVSCKDPKDIALLRSWKGERMKQIQIPAQLFMELVKFHLLDMERQIYQVYHKD